MSESFIPLAAFLRPPPGPMPILERLAEVSSAGDEPTDEIAQEYALAFSAIRRFRAGIADALDAAIQRLLLHIGESVVARELQIAPPDLAAIVAKARERAVAERAVAVRVHPTQRHLLAALSVEIHEDDRLAPGDVVLELRNGTIDLRLRTRLAMALAACEL
jgi:flagellar biosynthesis/type III secretory pathway protein FliH